MIPLKLKYTSIPTLEEIVALAKTAHRDAHLPNQDPAQNIEKSIEEIIEDYLLLPHENKMALEQYLQALSKDELIEILALYYFFAKLTYDTTVVSDEDQHTFWELCCSNASGDIERIGLIEMMDYLKERPNLSQILETVVINLK
jgi:DNA integrity scanning protein DisA with diadenylate cyclase activity